MGKKTIELDPNRPFQKSDAEKIYSFYKIATATREQMDEIYFYYKKYVNPNARPYIVNCKCGSSISSYYTKLLEWFESNRSKFEE